MDEDLAVSARYEVMEDEISLRARRLSDRIHEVERALTILAEEAHRTLHTGGPAGIDVLAMRVLDRVERTMHDMEVASIRREAEELRSMKTLAGIVCRKSEDGHPAVLARAA
jgi:hypothetical protein